MLESGDSIFAVRACHRFAALLDGQGSTLPDAEGLEALRSVGSPPCVAWPKLKAFAVGVCFVSWSRDPVGVDIATSRKMLMKRSM